MWAILSDIHGNLEALTAVLADIDRHAVERVFCLGDIVGYGPDPLACIDLVQGRCDLVLMGDLDQEALSDLEGDLSGAHFRGSVWTRAELNRAEEDETERERRWAFLRGLARMEVVMPYLFVHGSPRHPVNEYVFPEDIYNDEKMGQIFQLIDWVCFCGHTHVPGVFLDECRRYDLRPGLTRRLPQEGPWQFLAPEECGYTFHLDDRKVIVNVGSVGQPRDGDPRACYALLDRYTVLWRRLEYDMETTIRKVHETPELLNMHGDRLREGR